CDAVGQPVAIVGGGTGFGGGAEVQPGEIALSLERMTAMEPVDAVSGSVLAAAGVPLQRVQEVADAAGLFFGVDLGARGTATIGGNVATNAGGNRVLRHGMFRAQVLGLEAVLADGTIVSSLSGLVKDNAGYDLKQLFIGTEGTLGVVTRVKLKLMPKPASQTVAFVALPALAAALDLIALVRARLGPQLSAFELLWGDVYAGAVGLPDAARAPLPPGAPLYALIEQQGQDAAGDADRFEAALAEALEAGLAEDIVLTRSGRDVAAFW
ncbi:FAD-binding oxidoreductase, partial [Mycobacterium tuberculosis]|nr:FAD-binding oxidoreductase [Mycobacterium tuberculosis]